jgi:hypothetical protein
VGAPPLLPAQPAVTVLPRRGHCEAHLRARHWTCRTRYAGGALVLFVDADASQEEEGVAHVVDHTRDLCARARVDDAEFDVVEGDGGGAKQGTTVACDGADSASTTTIRSSNGNPMAVGSNLGPAVFLINFWCRLVTTDTKNRLFFVSHSWYWLQ